MRIWLTRHGQTDLNLGKVMQGRFDEPLNETGISQAKAARKAIGDIHFDAVYASPLDRALTTGAIIGGVDKKDLIVDPRIIEVDFGDYEKREYSKLGPGMTLYWALPEIFPAPKTVEPISSMIERSRSFLMELEQKDYSDVLVACHGGIIRTLRGFLEDIPRGYRWRPKPRNCEIMVYESVNGKHRTLGSGREVAAMLHSENSKEDQE